MFKENKTHLQTKMFSVISGLPKNIKKRLEKSWAPAFRTNIFEKIDEKRFSVLYSEEKSRPNFPINISIGLEIIKELFNYTDENLLDEFHFNLLTAYAVGIEDFGTQTMAQRTLYYCRKRLLEYEEKTGRNLLEEEFKAIGEGAIKQFSINTGVQRMDSSMVGSFIKKMSRLEILVKVLQNFYNDLSKAEKKPWTALLNEYIKKDADHITYRLKREEVNQHMKKVGELLYKILQTFSNNDSISKLKSYKHIVRVLEDQFKIIESKQQIEIEVIPGKEIKSTSLQNPADDEATYRKKAKKQSQGYLFNVTETCAKKNPAQILTDISVHQNIVSDDTILVKRIPEIKKRTDVKEIITDAAYPSETSEKICEEYKVKLIPTEIKGKKESDKKISLKEFNFTEKEITCCPMGYVPESHQNSRSNGRHTVHFSKKCCSNCELFDFCPVKKRKNYFSLLYTDRQATLAQLRQQFSNTEYRKKCRLRPAVEGTVSQFKRKLHLGKLRVRGFNRIQFSIIAMAMAINFKRIRACLKVCPNDLGTAFYGVFFSFIAFIFIIPLFEKKLSANLQKQTFSFA